MILSVYGSINSMEHSSWEVNGRSASREVLRFLWDKKLR